MLLTPALIGSVLSCFRFLILKVSGSRSFPPPLSREEEQDCFRRARLGDREARSCLIEHNLRLVAHIVKKYYAHSKNQEDIMSIGTVGLIKAVDSFDPDKGARFATYASRCLQNEILMYFRSQKKLSAEVSISETIDTDKDGNPLTYMDVIRCEDTIAEDLDRRLCTARACRVLREELEPREREILILRYGLGNQPPLTQREIAQRLAISRSYVSRLEKSALEKLRSALSR